MTTMISDTPTSKTRLGVGLDSSRRSASEPQAWKKNIGTKPIPARELDLMYRSFLPGQADPELLKKIVEAFEKKTPAVDPAVTLEIIAFIEAANKSGANHGAAEAVRT